MKLCAVEGCNKEARERGWCHAHYMRWYKRGGDPAIDHPRHSKPTVDPEELKKRLLRKSKPFGNGCRIWTGTKMKPFKQYQYVTGVTNVAGRRLKVHRLSWQLHHGVPIPAHLHVLHKCNEALCVNPEHLYLGTHAQNMHDMAASGRAAQKKLSDEEVQFIRNSSLSNPAIARLLGVNRSSVRRARIGENHKHLA